MCIGSKDKSNLGAQLNEFTLLEQETPRAVPPHRAQWNSSGRKSCPLFPIGCRRSNSSTSQATTTM
eukprot:22003-Amphidinium_carterae.1